MEDELYLERDENRILDCFSSADIEKKFGKRDDPEFQVGVHSFVLHNVFGTKNTVV